ncbi:MAG: Rpp14/Pop5 family protein [archaeon]
MASIRKKIKPLSPTLRERKRYLAFEAITHGSVSDHRSVYQAIEDSVLRLTGSRGLASAGLIPMDDSWQQKGQRGLVRVAHTSIDLLKAAMTTITKIDGKDAVVRSLGMSGILKKAKERYLAA